MLTPSDFEACCVRLFKFLRTDFGFGEPEFTLIAPESSIMYWKDTVRLTCFYEYGDTPWIHLELKKGKRWRQYSLDRLMAKRCPDISIVRPPFDEVESSHIETALQTYAGVLETHMADILGGEADNP